MNNDNNNHSLPEQEANPATTAQLAVQTILQQRGLTAPELEACGNIFLMHARTAALGKLETIAKEERQRPADPVWNPAWSADTTPQSSAVASFSNEKSDPLPATDEETPPIPSQPAQSLKRKPHMQDTGKRRKRKLPIQSSSQKPENLGEKDQLKSIPSETSGKNVASVGNTSKPQKHRQSNYQAVDEFMKNWEDQFKRLVEYKIKHNTTQVVHKLDPSLYHWSRCQRLARHRLTSRQDKLLESIEFDWSTTDLQENRREEWIKMYRQLVDYKKLKGYTHVPTQPKQFAALGFWADRQRKIGKKGLEQWRVNLLDEIDFAWDSKGKDNWMKMYQALLEFKKKNGTTFVSRTVDAKLAGWCRFQRNQCKEQWRIDLLNDINFHWTQKSDQNKEVWMKMYNDMVKYKNEYGTTCVPLNWKENRRLGIWVRNQRVACSEQWRKDLLNKVGFVWSVYTNRKDKKVSAPSEVSNEKVPPPSKVSDIKVPQPIVSNTKVPVPSDVSDEKDPSPSEGSNGEEIENGIVI